MTKTKLRFAVKINTAPSDVSSLVEPPPPHREDLSLLRDTNVYIGGEIKPFG